MNLKGKLGASVASVAMAALLAAPGMALADDANNNAKAASPDQAKLTKVVDAPQGTDLSKESFTFTFDGEGTVAKDASGNLYTAGDNNNTIAQDKQTLKEGDAIPTIDAVTLQGAKMTESNSVKGDGFAQFAVQKTIADIIDGVTFAHAGVYTYTVSETAATNNIDAYMVKSQASYTMRLYVENNADGTTEVKQVTIEKETKDDGTVVDGDGAKKDATYPQVTEGKITKEYETQTETITTPAGDPTGHDVNGFTFANEYLLGGQLIIDKQVNGDYGDKTREFPVTLDITSHTAPAGSYITYTVDGVDGEQTAALDENGHAQIKADLKDDEKITITGLYNSSDELIVQGINQGAQYTVSEPVPENYVGKGYTFDTAVVAEADVPNPTIDTTAPFNAASGETLTIATADGPRVTADGGHAFIFDVFKDQDVSPTGILVNNLPYLVLVGLPMVALMAWFVNRRRSMNL